MCGICLYKCVYLCIFVYIYVYICVYICVYMCICVYICVCICVYICVYMYAYVYMSGYVYKCVYLYIDSASGLRMGSRGFVVLDQVVQASHLTKRQDDWEYGCHHPSCQGIIFMIRKHTQGGAKRPHPWVHTSVFFSCLSDFAYLG